MCDQYNLCDVKSDGSNQIDAVSQLLSIQFQMPQILMIKQITVLNQRTHSCCPQPF